MWLKNSEIISDRNWMENGKQDNPWKTESETEVYSNPWIRVSHREVINPSGGKGIYGVVSFRNLAIGVVPVDEEMNTYLVGQFRYTLDEYSWEIPEGGGPEGEDPSQTAERELLEETGLLAGKVELLGKIHTSNSVTDEEGYIFLAQELIQSQANPEETEDITVKKLPLSEAIEMVVDGRITDSLSMAGLLLAGRRFGI
jgi:8-oxo-dGTP pyrophosphatase MutT (NUDIX family)